MARLGRRQERILLAHHHDESDKERSVTLCTTRFSPDFGGGRGLFLPSVATPCVVSPLSRPCQPESPLSHPPCPLAHSRRPTLSPRQKSFNLSTRPPESLPHNAICANRTTDSRCTRSRQQLTRTGPHSTPSHAPSTPPHPPSVQPASLPHSTQSPDGLTPPPSAQLSRCHPSPRDLRPPSPLHRRRQPTRPSLPSPSSPERA